MKVYNYSDKPVVINGVEIHDHLIHIDNSIQRFYVKHNEYAFLTKHTEERNLIYTIVNDSDGSGYSYRSDMINVPDVWVWVGIFLTFFSFHIVLRIVQKVRMS